MANILIFTSVEVFLCRFVAMQLFLIIANGIAFLLFGLDKFFAKLAIQRIPEKVLYLFAAAGCFGAWLAMLVFRHKTAKPTFKRTMYAISIIYILIVIFIYQKKYI